MTGKTMVGVPVKNAAFWLPKFLEEFDKLRGVSRVVFIYGDSVDQTLDILQTWKKATDFEVEVYHEPPMRAPSAHQISPVYQDFQEILVQGEETHFLLIDCDVTRYPPDLIERLMAHDVDIVAPYVWTDGHIPPKFFDTYCFRYNGARFHPFNPPNPGKLFEVDSVGTCYLAKREAFAFTPYGDRPHRSFCEMARKMGFKVWADPETEVFHMFVEQLGMTRVYPEAVEGLPPDRTPYIKRDGSLVPLEQMAPDIIYALIYKEVR